MRRCGGLCGRPGGVRWEGKGGVGRTCDVTVKEPKRIGFDMFGGILGFILLSIG